MKIAILEICAHTHYTLTNALIKTYSVDTQNHITVFTTAFIADVLKDGGISKNTDIVIFDKSNGAKTFLQSIENQVFDRLHICTIEDYYKEFTQFKPAVKKIFLHIHDIDTWFVTDFKSSWKNWLFIVKNRPNRIRETARFVRDELVRKPARAQILHNFRKEYDLSFVVLSQRQRAYMSQFVIENDIVVFPSLINEGIQKEVKPSQKETIRICIPGIVTDSRRDYSGLFNILEIILPQIKGKLIFDLLGFIEPTEAYLLERIQELEKKGLDIYYSIDFVEAKKFDSHLEKADILLNNQVVTVSHTGQYGVTKDSGMLFNIVRSEKPAIFPKNYAVDKEFESVLLYYSTLDDLKKILLDLANKTISLAEYQKNVEILSTHYTPNGLYKRLVPEIPLLNHI